MAEFERLFGPPGGRPFPGEEPPPPRPVSQSPLPSWPQGTHQPPTAQPSHPRPPSQQPYAPPPAYPPPGAAPDRAGDFTQFFGSGFTGEPVDVEREQQRAAAEPGAPSRKPFQQASEFTRMFGPGAQGMGDAPPPPPPPRTGGGWADQSGAYTMFGSKLNTPPPNMNRPIGEMTQQVGPSEYTRMISGGGVNMPGAGLNQDSSALKSGAMPAVKQVAGQQPGAAPSKAGQIGIAIAIVGFVIALIVAIVLLVMSK
ncbi:MAG: hypothetical protein IPJ98_30360 [Bryobacterales bacterium]|nr:hypothetical protein [Bryobacterales bacterium]